MSKRKKFLLYMITFILLLIVPVAGSITRNSKKEVTSGDTGTQLYSIKQGVKQDIILEGQLIKIVIPISGHENKVDDDCMVRVVLTQGDVEIIKSFAANEISNKIIIDSGFVGLEEGLASLSLYGENFSENEDLYVFASDSLTSGLPGAYINDDNENSPMCLSYEILQYNSIFFYSILLIILSFCLITYLSFALVNREKYLSNNFFFWISLGIIFLIISVNNPQTSFYAEPVSEMTYEFWYKAHNMDFFESLMSLMSGECIVWPERIIMFIADLITPTKYVFVVAQLIEIVFISASAAMLCLREFEKYIPIEFRLPVAIVMGIYGMYPKSYWFWTFSYWVMFFVVLFTFLDMNKMGKCKYFFSLITTVILCVSRLYNVVFIPMALLLLFVLKDKGRRFQLYCVVVACSSLFGIIYSLMAGGTGHLSSGRGVDILLFIENSVYWYIQAFNSLVYGKNISNQFAINILSLSMLIILIVWMIQLYMTKKKRNVIVATIILCAGIMGGGSVLLDVATMYMSSTVQMTHNYGANVDWTKMVYQDKDFHFGMAYFSFIIIGCTLFYYIWSEYEKKIKSSWINIRPLILVATSFVLFICYVSRATDVDLIRNLPVDWKKTCYITENDNYYMSVNNVYMAAPISLTQNSDSKIVGRDEAGNMYEWNYGVAEYTHSIPYKEADLSNIWSFKTDKILALTVEKAMKNFNVAYYANFYNESGDLLVSVRQANSLDRVYADFYMEEAISGVSKITFTTEDGYPVYVVDALQFGIYDINEGLSDDIHLSIDYCNGYLTQEGNGYVISNDEDWVVLEGWAEQVSTQDVVDKIEVHCANQILEAEVGIEKEDVARTLKSDKLLNCGWSISIPKDVILDDTDGVVEVLVYKGNEYRYFFYYFDISGD